MYQLQTSFNYSGELTEQAVKRRIFHEMKLPNWAGECDHRFMSGQATRMTRRCSVEKALSREGYGWHTAPKSLLLDLYWGIDAPVLFRGYRMGIDITTKEDGHSIRKKLSVLSYNHTVDQSPIHDVDRTAIWVCQSVPSIWWIKQTLRDMIHDGTDTVTYYHNVVGDCD